MARVVPTLRVYVRHLLIPTRPPAFVEINVVLPADILESMDTNTVANGTIAFRMLDTDTGDAAHLAQTLLPQPQLAQTRLAQLPEAPVTRHNGHSWRCRTG